MAVNETSSSSGEITSSFENISDVFTAYAEIPSGGFNRLYKAKRYGKWFVLKGLKPEFQRKAVYSELLTKEFELGVQMDHPNIAHTFSFETDPVAGPCIVMEYVDGCTLKEFLARRPSQTTRMKIAKEILLAMAYFHGKQIIHRDLKPDNILITHNGHNVKLIDFGLADTDYHGILKQPAGSDKYAAPEQKTGGAPLDCRADIYAFGIILQQLFPHGYGRIVRKCTQPDREKRLNNAEEVSLWLNRRKGLVPAILVLVLLCVGILAWLLSTKSHHNEHDPSEPITEVTSTEESPSVSVTEDIVIPANPITREEVRSAETPVKETVKTFEQDAYAQIPAEAKKLVESSLDTLFRPFWEWEKAATASGLSPTEKLTHYTQSDFFQNNYEIRERHREAVLNDLMRRYPQCVSIRETVTTYYNAMFVKRMVAVNNVVYGKQKATR